MKNSELLAADRKCLPDDFTRTVVNVSVDTTNDTLESLVARLLGDAPLCERCTSRLVAAAMVSTSVLAYCELHGMSRELRYSTVDRVLALLRSAADMHHQGDVPDGRVCR